MSRWAGQRHLGLATPRPAEPDIVLHRRVTAAEAMFLREVAQRSASPYTAASQTPSHPPLGSRRSPAAAAAPASACPPASSACSPEAARTGTSWPPSRGLDRKTAPLRAGSCLSQTQSPSIALHGIHPRSTPKRTNLSTGILLRRPAQHNAGVSVAGFVTAPHRRRGTASRARTGTADLAHDRDQSRPSDNAQTCPRRFYPFRRSSLPKSLSLPPARRARRRRRQDRCRSRSR